MIHQPWFARFPSIRIALVLVGISGLLERMLRYDGVWYITGKVQTLDYPLFAGFGYLLLSYFKTQAAAWLCSGAKPCCSADCLGVVGSVKGLHGRSEDLKERQRQASICDTAGIRLFVRKAELRQILASI